MADEVRKLAVNTQNTVGESDEIVRLIAQGINSIVAKMAETVDLESCVETWPRVFPRNTPNHVCRFRNGYALIFKFNDTLCLELE